MATFMERFAFLQKVSAVYGQYYKLLKPLTAEWSMMGVTYVNMSI